MTSTERWHKMRARKLAKHECINCTLPAKEGRQRCEKHLKEQLAAVRRKKHAKVNKSRREAIARGYCGNCIRRKSVPGKRRCAVCLSRARGYMAVKRPVTWVVMGESEIDALQAEYRRAHLVAR